MWAADVVYKTALFGSSYNSKGVSNYTDTWTATKDGFTVSLTNFNNNNNGWNYVKCGRKNNASVATIITNAVVDKAVTKVDITIDEVTTDKINSIKLYTSSDKSTWTEAGSYTVAKGTKSVSLASPTANLYYKVEFDCASGSANGLLTLSKVEYYYSSTKVSTPVISGAEKFLESTDVTITCGTEGAAIQYSTDGGANWINYDGFFTLTATTTVKAKATKTGLTDSDDASVTFTKVTPMTVAAAIAYIDLGENLTGQYVEGLISQIDSYSSNTITYWISDDGTTTTQMEVYKGKGLNGANFSAKTDLSVGDKVVVSGDLQKYGDIYEFSSNSQLISLLTKVKAPTFSPIAGVVAANTEVAISTITEGATIYYTTDGTNPTTSSSVYSTPITIDAAKTIKAIAVKDGYPDSDIATAAYTIAEPCATPTFSVAAGAYSTAQSVTISCATDGATIYYTTNGTEPTSSSTAYTSAISLSSDKTLKAIAIKDGFANSAIAEATYTFYAALPFMFDAGSSAIATTVGLSQEGLGSDYASSPKLKFDGTGDYLILKVNETIGTLAFNIKGNGFSGGTFKVQTSVDGSSYSDLASYTSLGDTQAEIFNNVPDNVRFIKWIYTTKSSGNVALGGINVQKYVSITPAKTYTTLTSAKALDFTGSGIKAFIVKDDDASDGYITLTEVSKVPANTGLVLKAETTGSPIAVNVLTGAADDVTGNKMAGSATETTAIAANGGYILSEGAFHPALAGTLAAGKAYLNIAVSAPTLTLDFGGTTGIKSVDNGQVTVDSSEVYNLNGQRVAQPTKGLYIVNGKKYMVK